MQNKKQAGKGYSYSGFPAWLVKVINDELKDAGVSKKTRERAFFIPIWQSQLTQKNIPKKFKRLDSFTVEQACHHVSERLTKETGFPKLVFTPVPNNHSTIKVLDVGSKTEIPFAGANISKDNKIRVVHFLNKLIGNVQHSLIVSKELYIIRAIDLNNGVPVFLLSNNKLKENGIYHIDSFVWYKSIQGDDKRGICFMRPFHYLFRAFEKKPDYKLFEENIEKITHWEDISFQWGYDTDIISLIMASVMYMEEGVNSLNLVLFGGTQIGKSSLFNVLSHVFGEDVIAGTKTTVKGLTGSAWENWTSGSLISSNYVALIDEMFRIGKQDAATVPTSDAISALLNSLTEILEHTNKQSSTGKGSNKMFFDKSMIGANNMMDFKVFEKAWKSDPAPFNRISILVLGDDVKRKMRELMNTDYVSPNRFHKAYEERLLKRGLNLATVRQMFMYARNVMLKKVEIDRSVAHSYLMQTRFVHDDYFKQNKFDALVKCAAVFNEIFSSSKLPNPNKKIIPKTSDYMLAVRWMDMLGDSFKNVMGLP